MEKRQAPELIYKDGIPQGYRVGIGINGAYGICPFCGKAYTKEDIKNPEIINFEHVYPRFAIKNALGMVNRNSKDKPKKEGEKENKKSPKIEANFKVASCKECNSNGKELEDTIVKLIRSVNTGGQLKPEQAEKVVRYCEKTSVFLRYLMDWENVPSKKQKTKRAKYKVVRIRPDSIKKYTLSYDNYDDFALFVKGLCFAYQEFNTYKQFKHFMTVSEALDDGPSSITIVLHNETLAYVKYKLFDMDYCYTVNVLPFDKAIPWKLPERTRWDLKFNYFLGNLPAFNSGIDVEENPRANPMLKKRLSLGEDYRSGIDDDIIFNQNGILYVYQNGIKCKLEDAEPYVNYFLNETGIEKLPNFSERTIQGAFFCNSNKLTTLDGAPKRVNNTFSCANNKLITLKNAPEYVKWFDCHNNLLTNLEWGHPGYVGGPFNCKHNKLISLEGAPEHIGGWFACQFNKLTTLHGAPKQIKGGFGCSNNELISLKGAPERVWGFGCSDNKLTTLEGGPKYVKGNFWCYRNKLVTLEGAPEHVEGFFDCRRNKLTTLNGAPKRVDGDFICHNNKLTSLAGAPRSVGGVFVFDAKHLHSLDGLPKARKYVIWDCDHKEFNSADELRAWFAEYKKQRDGKKSIVTGLRAGAKRVVAASAAQETKRKTKPSNQNEK